MAAPLLRSALFSMAVVAVAAALVIAAAAGWRLTVLAALASTAVAATRIRYSLQAAVCVLSVTAGAAYATAGGA